MTSLAELQQRLKELSEQRARAESTFLGTDDISEAQQKMQEIMQLRQEQRVEAEAIGTASPPIATPALPAPPVTGPSPPRPDRAEKSSCLQMPSDASPPVGQGAHVRSDDSDSADDALRDTGPGLREPPPAGAAPAVPCPQFPARVPVDAAGVLSAVYDGWVAVFGTLWLTQAGPPAQADPQMYEHEMDQLVQRCLPFVLDNIEREPRKGLWLKELNDTPLGQTPRSLLASAVAGSLAQRLLGTDVSVLYCKVGVNSPELRARTMSGLTVLFSSAFHEIGNITARARWNESEDPTLFPDEITLSKITHADSAEDTHLRVLGDRLDFPTMRGVQFFEDAHARIYILANSSQYCSISFEDTWYPAQDKLLIPSSLRLAAAIALFLVRFYNRRVCFVHQDHAHDVVKCGPGASVVLLRTPTEKAFTLPTPTPSNSNNSEGWPSSPRRDSPLSVFVQAWREEVELASGDGLESAVAAEEPERSGEQ